MLLRTFLVSLCITLCLQVQAQNLNQELESANSSSFALNFRHPQAYEAPHFSAIQFIKVIEEGTPKHPLIKTGKVLTFIGLPLLIIGGVMVASSDELYYHCVNGICEGDPKGGFGSVILASGIGLSGTGIILWTIGKNKSK